MESSAPNMPASDGPRRVLRFARIRGGLRIALAVFYAAIGVWHMASLTEFARLVPAWDAYPVATAIGTGLCEIAGAGALLGRRLRRLAGAMLALYVVCVLPANIRWIVEGIPFYGHVPGWDIQGPRLVFQGVLIWWALFCVGLIDWPFGADAGGWHGLPRRRPSRG